MGTNRSDRLVRLVGVFKLTKATVLLAAGVIGLAEAPARLAEWAGRALAWTGIYVGTRTLREGIGRLGALERTSEQRWSVVLLAYAAVFAVEGLGLLARKRWAEWMTVVVTTSFIPIEIYELWKQPGAGKVVAVVLNVAIVGYLVARRLTDSGGDGRARNGRWVGRRDRTAGLQ